MTYQIKLAFYRAAASGMIPAKWMEPELPQERELSAPTGRIHLEIVSHCWNYAHLLVYQLSSLVLYPPESLDVTMTVYYSTEDRKTSQLLDYFGDKTIAGVTWNWMPIPRQELFRRAIGRNRTALTTKADWVWFTDCDLMFRENCLDTLATVLQGQRQSLFYPEEERVTDLLTKDNPLLEVGTMEPQVLDVDDSSFSTQKIHKATGPLQIAHGDICRKVGYCRSIPIYLEPVESFAKCHEDRAFRWLLRTQGVGITVPGIYRIRHIAKGRYSGSKTRSKLRTWLRIQQSRWRDKKRRDHNK